MWLRKLRVMWPNALLAVIAAYATTLVVQDVATARVAPDTPVKPRAHAVGLFSAERHSRNYYDEIVKRDFFNLPAENGLAAQPLSTPADLPIVLVGVSKLSHAKPFIIVQDKASQLQSLFRLGEAIPNAGTVVAVLSDRAVLDRSGERIVLEMPKDFGIAAASRPASNSAEMAMDPRASRLQADGLQEHRRSRREEREARRAEREKRRDGLRQQWSGRMSGRTGQAAASGQQADPGDD